MKWYNIVRLLGYALLLGVIYFGNYLFEFLVNYKIKPNNLGLELLLWGQGNLGRIFILSLCFNLLLVRFIYKRFFNKTTNII